MPLSVSAICLSYLCLLSVCPYLCLLSICPYLCLLSITCMSHVCLYVPIFVPSDPEKRKAYDALRKAQTQGDRGTGGEAGGEGSRSRSSSSLCHLQKIRMEIKLKIKISMKMKYGMYDRSYHLNPKHHVSSLSQTPRIISILNTNPQPQIPHTKARPQPHSPNPVPKLQSPNPAKPQSLEAPLTPQDARTQWGATAWRQRAIPCAHLPRAHLHRR